MAKLYNCLTCVFAVAISGGILSGCFGPRHEEQLLAPAAKISVTHYNGTPISGPIPADLTGPATTRAATEPAPDVKAVVARFYVLEKMPLNALDPIGGYAQLITASRGGMPVLPTTKLTIGGRFTILKSPEDLWNKLSKSQYGRESNLATLQGLLRPGQTAAFTVEDPKSVLDTLEGRPVYRKVTVSLYRGAAADSKNAGRTLMAVSLEDIADTPVRSRSVTESSDDTGAPPTTQPTSIHTQRELALIQLPAGGDEQCVAALVPFQFEESGTDALVAVIQIASPVNVSDDLVAKADADVAESAEAVRKIRVPSSVVDTALTQAMASLSDSGTRQASMVYLAGQTRAGLCGDFVLAADKETLEKFVAKVQEKFGTGEPPADLGWQLDRLTFETLAKICSDRNPPAELRSVLTSFAGEAARHGSSLEELSQNLTSREELMRRLVAENMIYLEDNSPSARIRAYDWLAAHKMAPAGYDPLGRRKDREAALEKAAAQAGTTTGGQP